MERMERKFSTQIKIKYQHTYNASTVRPDSEKPLLDCQPKSYKQIAWQFEGSLIWRIDEIECTITVLALFGFKLRGIIRVKREWGPTENQIYCPISPFRLFTSCKERKV